MKMTPQRIEEIWAARGVQNDFTVGMTDTELAELKAFWRLLPGSYSLFDAFCVVMNNPDINAWLDDLNAAKLSNICE